jgi:hypothetical protein
MESILAGATRPPRYASMQTLFALFISNMSPRLTRPEAQVQPSIHLVDFNECIFYSLEHGVFSQEKALCEQATF